MLLLYDIEQILPLLHFVFYFIVQINTTDIPLLYNHKKYRANPP